MKSPVTHSLSHALRGTISVFQMLITSPLYFFTHQLNFEQHRSDTQNLRERLDFNLVRVKCLFLLKIHYDSVFISSPICLTVYTVY